MWNCLCCYLHSAKLHPERESVSIVGVLVSAHWSFHYRIIKLSSPKLNYIIGFGAVLLYISIILAVIPIHEGNRSLATSLCITIPWFTAVGYSLCYGTILVKMFRIWYIFNNPTVIKKPVSMCGKENRNES